MTSTSKGFQQRRDFAQLAGIVGRDHELPAAKFAMRTHQPSPKTLFCIAIS